MVVLRATRKVLPKLPPPGTSAGAPDTALGDWYVNRLVVDRQTLLLLVSSTSLLAILASARDVRTLPERLPALVAARLQRVGTSETLIEAEVAAMTPVVVARTQDRSVLGTMVDFAFAVPHYLAKGGWEATALPFVESRLAETPCRAPTDRRRTIFPDQEAPTLLAARWGPG